MRRQRLTGLALLLAALLALGRGAAQAPPRPGSAEKADTKKAKTPPPPLPDFTSLPPDAIIAIFDSAATVEALRHVPNAYVLTADRFRSLMEERDELRRQLDRPTAQTPTKLVLKGKVDGNLAVLQAQFEFETTRPGEIVRLGCGLAQATGVSLDGKTPRLLLGRPGTTAGRGEDEGFSVQVDRPGEHQLNLDLVLALSARTAGQGLALDLPRAPITRLELDLPAGSSAVTLSGKPLPGSGLALKGTQLAGNLGAVERLEIDWKPAQAASASAVRIADGLVHVRLSAKELTTEATLTLRLRAGTTRDWQLVVPREARVKVVGMDAARAPAISMRDDRQVSFCTITLKEPSGEPLVVTVSTRRDAPRPGSKPVPVGPFNVLGAARQSGSVLLSSSVIDWHLEPTPHGDLTRRPASEEELKLHPGLVAAFRYGPGDDRPPEGPAGSGLSWLDLEVAAVRGQLRTELEHLLTLERPEDGTGEGLRWRVRTTVTVTPRWAGIDRFAVHLPAGCELDEQKGPVLPERVRDYVPPDPVTRNVIFRLKHNGTETLAPITVVLECTYPGVDGQAPGKASLALPRPQGMIDKAGKVTVRVPANLELAPPEAEQAGGRELVRQSTHELEWRYLRKAPQHVEVAWRAHRPAVRVTSVIDLVLGRGQGQVRHELRYELPGGATTNLSLKVPPAVVQADSLRVRQGGRVVGAVEERTSVLVPAPLGPRKPSRPVLELTYSFGLPAAGSLVVPLVVPEGATQGETRVRIWSEPGLLPRPVGDGWLEENIEEVAGRERLPVLVLRSMRVDAGLRLRLGEEQAGVRVLVERALVRVTVGPDGTQTYRVGYRLARLAGGDLDLELPAPVATINLTATLDGKRISHELPGAAGEERPATRATLVRLRLSAGLVRRLAVLELAYQLPPDRVGRSALRTPLVPPRLLGEAGQVPARWQITAPADWVVLGPEPGPGAATTWGWRGWLLAPRSRQSTADLEAWFAGRETAPSDGPVATPTLVLWRDGSAEVTLTHVTYRPWLVSCSLGLFVLGLLLSRLALSPVPGLSAWAWVLGGVVVLSGLVLVVLAPALAGQVAHGCQPGLLVLLLFLLVQWLLHERYRRQIIFLPSFSRARSGSSLSRGEAARPNGEPSTVDAPPRGSQGSSVERKV